MKAEYALYKGEEFIDLGTKKYLATILGVKEQTISFYLSPTYRKRTTEKNGYRVIKIEE